MPEPLLIRAHPAYAAVVTLLETEGLPASDLTDRHLEHFFFAGSDGSPSGLVGLELHGREALLRSLVVAAQGRGLGLGRALVQHAEGHARSLDARSIYLLTTTAELFFRRLGYERLDRSKAPLSIRSTLEFASLCPASSAFMAKAL
jgi:amino-acid N-acetyltransferase